MRAAKRKESVHETCRRHGDGHRLLDRQQHPGGRGLAAPSEVRHRRRVRLSRHGFPLSGGRRRQDRSRRLDRPARTPFHGRHRRLRLAGHGSGAARQRPRGKRHRQRKNRPHRRFGRAVHQNADRRRRHRARFQPQARRPLRGAQGDVVDLLGGAVHLVQDQGRQLFDQFGLCHQRALHRQRLGIDRVGQAGRDLRRRR